jgi:hypothetical protein
VLAQRKVMISRAVDLDSSVMKTPAVMKATRRLTRSARFVY